MVISDAVLVGAAVFIAPFIAPFIAWFIARFFAPQCAVDAHAQQAGSAT
jgi:hypothetical protein